MLWVNKAHVFENETITSVTYKNLTSGLPPPGLPMQVHITSPARRKAERRRKTGGGGTSTSKEYTNEPVLCTPESQASKCLLKPRPNLPPNMPHNSLLNTYHVPSYLTYPVSLASRSGSLTYFTDKEKAAQRLTCPRQGQTITKWRCTVSNSNTQLETGLLVPMAGALRILPLLI